MARERADVDHHHLSFTMRTGGKMGGACLDGDQEGGCDGGLGGLGE